MNETGYIAPKGRYVPPVLFNPYTGEPRDARDIASDPHGVLIVPPGAMLAAAPQAPAAPVGVPAQGDPAALLQLAEVLESGRSLIHVERKEAAHALRLQAAAAPAAPGIDQLLDALSQHDDPCEDIADALDRVRTLRAEADRRIRAENTRVDRMAHLSAGVLNVLRVALNRANMDYRATGFKPFEIDAAKTWVASAAPAAPAVDAREPIKPQHPKGMTSVNARLSFNHGWTAAERAHGIRPAIDPAAQAKEGGKA